MADIDDVDDHWSDAPETIEDALLGGHPDIEELHGTEGEDQDLTVRGLKVATGPEKLEHSPTGILQSSMHMHITSSSDGTPPSPTHVTADPERALDPASSVHSLPIVHVTEPPPSPTRPSTARSPESFTQLTANGPPSPARTHMSAHSSLASNERRMRHRSALDTRGSNRLSGFFSNLIHRRDIPPSPSSRNINRDDRASSPTPVVQSNSPSRSSSPSRNRPVTPPPELPPPTLQELGLSLSVITSDLSPSHFSTPPSSGAFLSPHYLLLCHAQGLDVLPLVSPPAPQPYALVRRVSFKSVVVMEQRGVLVAIAGRRDGVRVYALEEVKKAVEWRMDAEIRRERERSRRDEAKKASSSFDNPGMAMRDSDRKIKARLSSPPPSVGTPGKGKVNRRSSVTSNVPAIPIPRTPIPKKAKSTPTQTPPIPPMPFMPSDEVAGRPPPYSSGSTFLRSQASVVSLRTIQTRRGSVSDVLSASTLRRAAGDDPVRNRNPDAKTDDWVENRGESDEEAIDIVAAGPSGSQALDERTSAPSFPSHGSALHTELLSPNTHRSSLGNRRNRPANLDLSLTHPSNTSIVPPEPSPTPTLLTLRQALSHSPTMTANSRALSADQIGDPYTPRDEDDDGQGSSPGEQLTLVQALLESRLPDLPPIGTRRLQQPILIIASDQVVGVDDDAPVSPRQSEAHSVQSTATNEEGGQRRRRWSVLDGIFSNSAMNGQSYVPSNAQSVEGSPPATREQYSGRLGYSPSLSRARSPQSSSITPPERSTYLATSRSVQGVAPPSAIPMSTNGASSHSHSRFIPRIISNAFSARRSEEQQLANLAKNAQTGTGNNAGGTGPNATPPKLEYVKLPGTKGALMVKAVETTKKSFLAILCGESGEKVELFAGTYRTALGLSRTFILPDSPRLLELQLQGDDLVEVFLVFAQNVFGLEPATVRVREVRIGRAERRAARRRAREMRVGDGSNDLDAPMNTEEDVNVNVNIGITIAPGSTLTVSGHGPHPADNQPSATAASPNSANTSNPEPANPATLTHAEELVALATVQAGPYTTFQQLSFAPNFPLASIADEYIIPPTYPSFLTYRAQHEPEVNGSSTTDLAQVQFSPPGLPVPVATPPSKWFYRDPKGLVHGPWKASLMQAWYKDGLLPPDLPVRREEETEYVLLRDLRLQSVDPTHPFRSPPPPLHVEPLSVLQENAKPLLAPISLLSQPKHFGPPALFFSSRGGHSTTIVDARGRSVLKGRFLWSSDEQDDDLKSSFTGRMGDVKRLETFDVRDRSVLVAMRQGGLEAVDLADALLKPADESRTVLPQFSPPPSNVNRRGPFVWKIGTPVSASPTSSTILSNKTKSGYHTHRKLHSGGGKTPGRTDFALDGDVHFGNNDEVLFLGRRDNEIYLCERNAGSFRLLLLTLAS